MLSVFENVITNEEIACLQQQLVDLKATVKFDAKYLNNSDISSELQNSESKSLVVEQLCVNSYPVAESIRRMVNRILPNPLKNSIPIIFVRAVNPLGIHTDTDERYHKGHTILIPLTSDDRIKTVVWRETAIAQKGLNAIFQRFQTDLNSFQPQPKINDKFNLGNCWSGRPSIVDFLELDGVAEWHTGSIFKFERQQLHASNDFRKFVEFKDYVKIHNDE